MTKFSWATFALFFSVSAWSQQHGKIDIKNDDNFRVKGDCVDRLNPDSIDLIKKVDNVYDYFLKDKPLANEKEIKAKVDEIQAAIETKSVRQPRKRAQLEAFMKLHLMQRDRLAILHVQKKIWEGEKLDMNDEAVCTKMIRQQQALGDLPPINNMLEVCKQYEMGHKESYDKLKAMGAQITDRGWDLAKVDFSAFAKDAKAKSAAYDLLRDYIPIPPLGANATNEEIQKNSGDIEEFWKSINDPDRPGPYTFANVLVGPPRGGNKPKVVSQDEYDQKMNTVYQNFKKDHDDFERVSAAVAGINPTFHPDKFKNALEEQQKASNKMITGLNDFRKEFGFEPEPIGTLREIAGSADKLGNKAVDEAMKKMDTLVSDLKTLGYTSIGLAAYFKALRVASGWGAAGAKVYKWLGNVEKAEVASAVGMGTVVFTLGDAVTSGVMSEGGFGCNFWKALEEKSVGMAQMSLMFLPLGSVSKTASEAWKGLGGAKGYFANTSHLMMNRAFGTWGIVGSIRGLDQAEEYLEQAKKARAAGNAELADYYEAVGRDLQTKTRAGALANAAMGFGGDAGNALSFIKRKFIPGTPEAKAHTSVVNELTGASQSREKALFVADEYIFRKKGEIPKGSEKVMAEHINQILKENGPDKLTVAQMTDILDRRMSAKPQEAGPDSQLGNLGPTELFTVESRAPILKKKIEGTKKFATPEIKKYASNVVDEYMKLDPGHKINAVNENAFLDTIAQLSNRYNVDGKKLMSEADMAKLLKNWDGEGHTDLIKLLDDLESSYKPNKAGTEAVAKGADDLHLSREQTAKLLAEFTPEAAEGFLATVNKMKDPAFRAKHASEGFDKLVESAIRELVSEKQKTDKDFFISDEDIHKMALCAKGAQG